MGERMGLLVSDGGEGRDHHVEAIEPRPAFDEVKTGSARERKPEQGHADEPQVAKRFHGPSVVGLQSSGSVLGRVIPTGAKRAQWRDNMTISGFQSVGSGANTQRHERAVSPTTEDRRLMTTSLRSPVGLVPCCASGRR